MKKEYNIALKTFGLCRNVFIDNYNVDLPLFNDEQMLHHHNKNSTEKTLSILGYDTYVKVNCSL